MGEFDLIGRHFVRAGRAAPGAVPLGIGDDCALLAPPGAGSLMAVSTDMLVSGRHFFDDVDPVWLGHKALAVNLSDLAAMGATPRAFALALALPALDDAWLAGFAQGMFALADAHGAELVGGDTTRGPLNVCITVLGDVPAGQALRRDAARAGDDVWVSGTIGAAAWAVRRRLAGEPVPPGHPAVERLERPMPRVALGIALRGVAGAAIDLSDGLAGDLGHLLARSAVGAELDLSALPVHDCLDAVAPAERLACALTGGDDYELAFTAAADRRDAVQAAAQAAGVPVTRVGVIATRPGLRLMGEAALRAHLPADLRGFDHFRE